MTFRFDVIIRYLPRLLSGLVETGRLSAFILVIAFVVGLGLSLLRMSKFRIGSMIATVYIQFFRNIPRLVILIWIYYCTAIIFDLQLDAFLSAVIAFSLQQAAYVAETIRSGIVAVDPVEIQAARSLGLGSAQILRKIILPQAFRTVIPAFVNQFVIIIKTTTIAALIGVHELLHTARSLSEVIHRPLEFYTAIGILYFIVCFIFSRMAQLLETRLTAYRR
ncbi:amino acid ABC transporter permease [Candidatus Bipolaricaulota bacterium]